MLCNAKNTKPQPAFIQAAAELTEREKERERERTQHQKRPVARSPDYAQADNR
jgi:hypothetical protein